MKALVVIFSTILLIPSMVMSQSDINQTDSEGKRHGLWRKYHPGTQQVRYEGRFEHGKEIGVFNFYCQECGQQPSVIKTFDKNSNTARVQYFTVKGKLVSEGSMDGKNRVGEWVYYHEKSSEVMTREFYTEGKLDGTKTTYYLNGQITEEMNYVKGLMHGPNKFYSPDGVLIKDMVYVQDKLHGPANYYDASGNLVIKGQYKNDKKHGLWTYYKDGELLSEETYPKPREKSNRGN